MTITPPPTIDLDATLAWPDELLDLTDRRRLLLLALFGVDVTPAEADAVFACRQLSSTTIRSGGRSSSTVDT